MEFDHFSGNPMEFGSDGADVTFDNTSRPVVDPGLPFALDWAPFLRLRRQKILLNKKL